ncbi:Protein of unknown function [Prosthecobacter debontii]|uniref:DUF1549 domain-containing protein n=1 Tax=Prosthecobacter debontii TaxID=48467 RepID=A0A1T4XTA1_9BACT|nr:DUF1549 domain-containing protein [Prosthecobacter debontii]SKA92754.1 Protein of unknown function [Prosthecobacter debontii]
MKKIALFLLAATLSHGAALPEAAQIDSLLAADWQKQNLQPNPPASDDVIVRRLYLDIAGRIPSLDERQDFMQSTDRDKRAKLIDKLLASDGYTSHMFNFWADVLRLTDNAKGKITAEAYEEWLKKELKANTPYDEFVKKLLTTEGGAWDSGSIGFYQRDENKLDHLAYTVQVFLGTSIVCAQCHNHPFDKWSQMDYYSMAAFTYGMDTRGSGSGAEIKIPKKPQGKQVPDVLADMKPKERRQYMKEHPEEVAKMREEANKVGSASREELQQVRKALGDVMKPLRYTSVTWHEGKLPKLPDDYKYKDGQPGEAIQPRAMFGHEAKPKEGQTTIQAFADWMTDPKNPRFTTVIANRMWKHVFGLGLIEPLDEMTDSTVASNPALMDYLAQLMIDKQYSIKSFLRVLYNTDTYQRMASTQEVALGETYHFTGPTLRRMSAEQIWDSLLTLTQGNKDSEVDEENVRLHQYLGDLNMFINTMKTKGPEGIIAAAKEGMEQRKENDRKLDEMRAKIAAQKGNTNDPAAAKELARAASKLRREASNDLLVNLIGEERAEDLIRGYNPNRQNKRTTIDKKALASLPREERKQAAKAAANNIMVARASELNSPARPGHLLRTFGQSDRELIDNANDDASVPQALTMLNGPVVESLTSPLSLLSQHLDKAPSPEQKGALLYEALLSRRPTQEENTVLTEVFHDRGDKAVDDITHALITGSQFLFIQ